MRCEVIDVEMCMHFLGCSPKVFVREQYLGHIPNIPIPYIASEYMNGGDPVLEKLLKYLKDKKTVIAGKNDYKESDEAEGFM